MILYIILIIITLILLILLPRLKKKKEGGGLLDYILSLCKKRKFALAEVKNTVQNTQTTQNKPHYTDKIEYKKLKPFKIFKPLKAYSQSKNKTYVENELASKTKALISICPLIEGKINKNINRYRAIGGQTIIEAVATSYAEEVLVLPSFDMFENFRNLTRLVKVYKKEAEILNILVISKLLQIYLKLGQDIIKIKSDIKKASHCIVRTKTSPAYIYGLYKFNKQSSRFALKKDEVIFAVNQLLSELDQIYEKQRVVYNYIKYLYKGII